MSTYKSLLKKLKRNIHHQIVVAGPHRSGTTFITKVLANDLDYQCCLEEGVGNVLAFLHGALNKFRAKDKPSVYQSPLLTAYCHTLGEETAVVYLYRPIEDIMASELRLGWSKNELAFENSFKKLELSKYFGTYKDAYNNSCVAELAKELKKDKEHEVWCKRPISETKYMIWENYQKPLVKYAYDLEYNSIKGHKLWVDKEKRKNFGSRQTEV